MPTPKKRSKGVAKQISKDLVVEELSPKKEDERKEQAAVIGIYRFDQLPLPKGEPPQSLGKLFREQAVSNEPSEEQKKLLERELLSDE